MCFCTYPLLYTPRHPENFDFRAFRSGVSQNRNSWGSSDYQVVMNQLDHPDDKAFWGNSRLCVSGRLPHFCMRSFRFPTPPKMQKFAMTRFLTTMSGITRHRSVFFFSAVYISSSLFRYSANARPDLYRPQDSTGRRRREPKGTRVELVFGNSEGERLVLRAGGKFT